MGNGCMTSINTTVKLRLFQLFMGGTASNLVKPFFAATLALGIGSSEAGTAMMLCGLVALLAGLTGGGHSDVVGRTRILLCSELIRLVGAAFLLWAFYGPDTNYLIAVLGFTLHSTGAAYGRSAGDALLYDNMDESNRKLITRLHYWVWNFTVLLGYLLGGAFFLDNKPAFFFILFFISLLDIAIISQLQEPKFKGTLTLSNWKLDRIPIYLLKKDRVFRLFIFGSSLQLIVEVGAISLLSVVFLKENILGSLGGYELTPLVLFSLLITLNAIVLISGGLLLMTLFPHTDSQTELWLGTFFLVLGVLGLFLSPTTPLLIASMVSLSVGELLFKSSRNETFARLIPGERKGAYSSINSSVFRVASAVAPILLVLYDWLSVQQITSTLVVLLITAGFLLNIVILKQRKEMANVT
ncbi:hypothetical protein M892_21585 [Vibrio campbellii ATCC BAA-1116]|nr:hypothetical protein M892_21585 [Vibrio campbellii ATCC BAA-1116]